MDLIADHISHRFGVLAVLDDVSFTVRAGEVVAIVGPSGCGKSTLLSILGGLLQPSAGSAALRGAPPSGSLNPLTFVFQDFALLPWCTVEENVEFPLRHTALAETERRAVVEDALRRTSLADFRTTYPKQLSGGMRQRVGIARALAVRPAILLMDEPLSALDSQTRELLMEDFVRLLADGAMGAAYVTHNLEETRPGPRGRHHSDDARRTRRHRRARETADAAKRIVVADPRGGDRCRARGPACLTARRHPPVRPPISTPRRGRSRFAAAGLPPKPAAMPAGSRWRW
jgi:NitT/TauT family transport system ATP-binding protein